MKWNSHVGVFFVLKAFNLLHDVSIDSWRNRLTLSCLAQNSSIKQYPRTLNSRQWVTCHLQRREWCVHHLSKAHVHVDPTLSIQWSVKLGRLILGLPKTLFNRRRQTYKMNWPQWNTFFCLQFYTLPPFGRRTSLLLLWVNLNYWRTLLILSSLWGAFRERIHQRTDDKGTQAFSLEHKEHQE